MGKPLFGSGQADGVLSQVYEGMNVYDRTGRKVGTVEYVYLGDVIDLDDEHSQEQITPSVRDTREVSFIEDFARAIVIPEQVSDTLRQHLLRLGFIRINSIGLFTPDRYALPDQIASVFDGRVILRVDRDELIRA
jgi:hypothetical protein